MWSLMSTNPKNTHKYDYSILEHTYGLHMQRTIKVVERQAEFSLRLPRSTFYGAFISEGLKWGLNG